MRVWDIYRDNFTCLKSFAYLLSEMEMFLFAVCRLLNVFVASVIKQPCLYWMDV